MTTIHVRQEHIDNGEDSEPCFCPVALAIQDVVKPHVEVEVNRCEVTLRIGTEETVLDLPADATAFIDDFDEQDIPTAPFTFPLDIPERFLGRASS